MRALRRLFLCSAAALAVGVVGATATPAAAAPTEDYGPWLPAPGEQRSGAIYNPDLEPFNDEKVSEHSSFVCVDEQGHPISVDDRELISQIVLAATDVYDGDFEFGDGAEISGKGKKGESVPPNGGYSSGASGMRDFLAAEKSLLNQGKWQPYTARAMIRSAEAQKKTSYQAARAGWSVDLGSKHGDVNPVQGARVAALLPSDASHPLSLTANLPEACALEPTPPEEPTLSGMLESPGQFFIDEMLYFPGKLASEAFSFLQPYAFRYTFWTPHSERGDLMWNIPQSCTPGGEANRYFSTADINDACEGGKPLGFSEANANSGGKAWYIAAADFLQWLVSGTYFLILFAAALVYMFRGSRASSLGLLRLIPRLLMSIVLTMFAGVIIGALISVSNLAVQTIFDFDSAPTVGAINTFLLQAGNIVGGPELIQRLTQLLVGSVTVFYYLAFVVASLVRQVLLVVLIILAPVAALCLVVPRWRQRFGLYARTLLVVVFLPVVLAFLLKVGTAINPLLANPEGAYGGLEGLVGLILMVVTLWLMWRALRLAKHYVVAGGTGLKEVFSRLPHLNWHPRVAVDGPSGTLGSAERDSARRGELVPAERVAAGTTGADKAKLVSRVLGAGGEGAAPAVPANRSLGAADNAAPKALAAFQQKKQVEGGPRRISAAAARAYREGLRKAVEKAKKLKGGELTPEELEELKSDWANANGGRLERRGGSWYLREEEPQPDMTAEQANAGPKRANGPVNSH